MTYYKKCFPVTCIRTSKIEFVYVYTVLELIHKHIINIRTTSGLSKSIQILCCTNRSASSLCVWMIYPLIFFTVLYCIINIVCSIKYGGNIRNIMRAARGNTYFMYAKCSDQLYTLTVCTGTCRNNEKFPIMRVCVISIWTEEAHDRRCPSKGNDWFGLITLITYIFDSAWKRKGRERNVAKDEDHEEQEEGIKK